MRSKQDAQPRKHRMHMGIIYVRIERCPGDRPRCETREAVARETYIVVFQSKDYVADHSAFEPRANEPSTFTLGRARYYSGGRTGSQLEL